MPNGITTDSYIRIMSVEYKNGYCGCGWQNHITCLCKNIINCNLHEPYGLCLRGSNNDLFLVEESGNGNKSSPLKNNLNAYIYIYVDFTNV